MLRIVGSLRTLYSFPTLQWCKHEGERRGGRGMSRHVTLKSKDYKTIRYKMSRSANKLTFSNHLPVQFESVKMKHLEHKRVPCELLTEHFICFRGWKLELRKLNKLRSLTL